MRKATLRAYDWSACASHPIAQDDGTFWIAREDFIKEFRCISICISDENAAERYSVSY